MDAATAHDLFFHVRVMVGIVTGLSVTRLLTGLARFVQHPGREPIYLVHLGWALYLILAVILFWWFEFGLVRVPAWNFPTYFFVICYAALSFFTSAILFPDRMDDYAGFADYFHSRQNGSMACWRACSSSTSSIPPSKAPTTSTPSAAPIPPPGAPLRARDRGDVHSGPPLSHRFREPGDRRADRLDRATVRGDVVNYI